MFDKSLNKTVWSLTKNKWFKIAILLVVFYFTFVLRAHNYDRIPEMGHLEEMLYAWSGMYLWETGVPVSWSTLDYPERAKQFVGVISYQGSGGKPNAGVTLYKPWLDEPPLFSLLVGGSNLLFGEKKDQFPASSHTRFPMIFIGALTSLMVFLITRKLSNFWMGILAMLVYGTVPIFVLASRTAVPENLIGLLFSICVYLILFYQQKQKLIYIVFIPILIGIAGLSKPTGYFLLPLVLFFVLKLKKQNHAIFLVLATIPFILAFIAYGMYYDSEIFWKIVGIQGFRPVGFSSLAWFFSSPAYYIKVVIESWYVFGLLSFGYFLFNPPQEKLKEIVLFATTYWVIIVMLSGGEQDVLPWYRFPAFPLMAIILAWGLELLVKKNSFYTTFIAAGMLLGNRVLLVNAFRPNISTTFYRNTLSLLMLPSVLQLLFQRKWLEKLNRLLIIAIIVIGFYLNSVFIYSVFDITCEGMECLIGESTWLSELRIPFFWRLFTW